MRRLIALLVVVGLCVAVGVFFSLQPTMTAKAQANALMAGVGTPILDGVASEGEWPSDSIMTGRDVNIKAMIDGSNLYVLAQWADSTNSTAKDQWTFDGADWNGAGDEDRISFIWDMKDAAGNSLNGEEGLRVRQCVTPPKCIPVLAGWTFGTGRLSALIPWASRTTNTGTLAKTVTTVDDTGIAEVVPEAETAMMTEQVQHSWHPWIPTRM